jgi:hypothetical protein
MKLSYHHWDELISWVTTIGLIAALGYIVISTIMDRSV